MSRSRWWPVWAWGAMILVGTSIPGSELPPAFPYADKLAHLLLYGTLGAVVARALGHAARDLRTAALAVALMAAFGGFDEWHQDFVPGRASDPADWLADVVGAAAGLLVTTTLRSEQRI